MHYLSSLEQILGNLKGLGARRLTILGVVFTLVFALVGGGSYLLTRSSFETIYSGLSPQDVTRISKVLSEAGVAFEVGLDGTRISVSRGSGPQVRAMLAERGLPSNSASGYELFDKIGPMGLTSFMQDMTRVRALEGEIARTIQGMRGIKSARVHIVLPEPQTLRRSPQSASASVVIKTETANDPSAVPAIRHLVAAAVPGLATGNVRVLSVDGAVLAADGEEGDSSPGKLLDLQRVVSKGLQNNIRQALAPYLGVGHFEVSVAVRLNVDNRITKEVTYDPEGKVERSTRVVRETSSSQNAKGGWQTVTVEQVIPSEGAKSGGNDQLKRSMQKRDETTSYEIASRSTATTSAGYRIEKVTAAVVLDRKRIMGLLGSGANDEALMKQVAEIEKVVAAAAGIDSKRGDHVTVAALEFADAATSEAPPAPGVVDRLMGHLDTVIKALALLGVTFALIFLGLKPLTRAMSASVANDVSLAVAGPAAAVSLNAETSEPLSAAPSLSGGEFPAAPRMLPETPVRRPDEARERLQRMVEADEEQAAAVLRRWVREGHER
jgi:flagellar M-ring protein FliF